MTTEQQLIVTHSGGEELFKVWSLVEPVLEGFPINVVVPALLAIVITAQHPEISDEALRDGVKSASQHIVLLLSELTPKEQMN